MRSPCLCLARTWREAQSWSCAMTVCSLLPHTMHARLCGSSRTRTAGRQGMLACARCGACGACLSALARRMSIVFVLTGEVGFVEGRRAHTHAVGWRGGGGRSVSPTASILCSSKVHAPRGFVPWRVLCANVTKTAFVQRCNVHRCSFAFVCVCVCVLLLASLKKLGVCAGRIVQRR